ncbi:hypothetical protein TcCL_NonESM01667 [Trypanosoma cruzi]|nr:hypothetical protein TcCL_NonESM01667 [Trypanosoma cruzi]
MNGCVCYFGRTVCRPSPAFASCAEEGVSLGGEVAVRAWPSSRRVSSLAARMRCDSVFGVVTLSPGSFVVRRRSANGVGLGYAFRRGGAIGVPSLALVFAQVAGVGSGGISGGSDSPGKLTFHGAWGRVTPWALTMCVTTPVQQLKCSPHTGQSVGRRIVAGWGQREEEAFPCEVHCVPAVRHPRCTNSMCSGWRAAVVVAAIRG